MYAHLSSPTCFSRCSFAQTSELEHVSGGVPIADESAKCERIAKELRKHFLEAEHTSFWLLGWFRHLRRLLRLFTRLMGCMAVRVCEGLLKEEVRARCDGGFYRLPKCRSEMRRAISAPT